MIAFFIDGETATVVTAVLGLIGVIYSSQRSSRNHFDVKLDTLAKENHKEHMNNLKNIHQVMSTVQSVDAKIDSHLAYHEGREKK